MIVRPPLSRDGIADGDKAVAVGISQTTHGWLTGELARHWLPAHAGMEAVPNDLLIAAALHDVGHGPLERRPVFNPETGLPRSFRDLPYRIHLETWRGSVEDVRPISRYAALFVSKHTTHLAEDQARPDNPGEQSLVETFLRESYLDQEALANSLRLDPTFAPCLSDEKIDLQQKLLAGWDRLSLYLCGALGEPDKIGGFPSPDGTADLLIIGHTNEVTVLTLFPWPFRAPEIKLCWDARIFRRHFKDQSDLDQNFRRLETIRVGVTLRSTTQ